MDDDRTLPALRRQPEHGYKWLDRYRQSGARGLYDHSRAPRSCPHQTPADLTAMRFSGSGR
ncbi:MAG: hypothetical protein H0X69_10625 [Gemmatimonadales bacterium]|nr:hypothetical protein [Gemmatimonadales bacterium]